MSSVRRSKIPFAERLARDVYREVKQKRREQRTQQRAQRATFDVYAKEIRAAIGRGELVSMRGTSQMREVPNYETGWTEYEPSGDYVVEIRFRKKPTC